MSFKKLVLPDNARKPRSTFECTINISVAQNDADKVPELISRAKFSLLRLIADAIEEEDPFTVTFRRNLPVANVEGNLVESLVMVVVASDAERRLGRIAEERGAQRGPLPKGN